MAPKSSMSHVTRMSALDKLPSEERERLERQARDICGLFSKEKITFELKGPEKLTVLRDGLYTKLAFIGEEIFHGAAAYVGKSGKVIVQLTLDGSDGSQLVEVPLMEMMTKFEGFSVFTRKLSEYQENLSMNVARAMASEIESAAHEQAIRARESNPNFGSW